MWNLLYFLKVRVCGMFYYNYNIRNLLVLEFIKTVKLSANTGWCYITRCQANRYIQTKPFIRRWITCYFPASYRLVYHRCRLTGVHGSL